MILSSSHDKSCDSHMFGITSLSRSGRNEVSTAGSLPSLFFLCWGGHGDAGRESDGEREEGE